MWVGVGVLQVQTIRGLRYRRQDLSNLFGVVGTSLEGQRKEIAQSGHQIGKTAFSPDAWVPSGSRERNRHEGSVGWFAEAVFAVPRYPVSSSPDMLSREVRQVYAYNYLGKDCP